MLNTGDAVPRFDLDHVAAFSQAHQEICPQRELAKLPLHDNGPTALYLFGLDGVAAAGEKVRGTRFPMPGPGKKPTAPVGVPTPLKPAEHEVHQHSDDDSQQGPRPQQVDVDHSVSLASSAQTRRSLTVT
jgi:hypothetical protein